MMFKRKSFKVLKFVNFFVYKLKINFLRFYWEKIVKIVKLILFGNLLEIFRLKYFGDLLVMFKVILF